MKRLLSNLSHGRVLSVAQVRTTLGGRKALHQHEHRRLGRGHRVDRLPTGRVEAARCTQGASCHPGASFRAKHPVLCTPSDGPCSEPLTSVGFPGMPACSTRKGWLHFYLRQKRNEWFTFATRARMSRGGRPPRSRAALHITAKQSAHTVGGTACADCLTATWSSDPRR